MDFFRGCRTNVHRVNQISDIRCLSFNHGQEKSGTRVMHEVLAELRKCKRLCANAGPELWVFLPPETPNDLVSQLSTVITSEPYEMSLTQESTVGAELAKGSNDGEQPQGVLLRAVEAALSFSLASANGCLYLAPWTWIQPGVSGEPSLALHMHVTVSATGAFHAMARTEASRLSTIRGLDQLESRQLHIVPGGHAVEHLRDGDGNAITRHGQWKEGIRMRLRTFGILVGDNEEWLPLRLEGLPDQDCFLWPSSLVLTRTVQIERPNIDSEHDLERWFISAADAGGYESPLTRAESWLNFITDHGSADLLADEDLVTSDMADIELHPDTTDLENVLVTSPPCQQRSAEQQAAMVGIYPTPPDGLVPGHAPLHPSGGDSVPAHAIVEPNTMSDEVLEEPDGPLEGDRSLDSLNVPSVAFPPDTDDLFGDMVEMDDFTRDEVGDADFSFFDEPDDIMPPDSANEVGMSEPAEETQPTDDPDHSAALAVQGESASATSDMQHSDTALASEHHAVHADEAYEPMNEAMDKDDPTGSTAGRGSSSQGATLQVGSEKPLSPFGIRERLLPPPIPASARHQSSSLSPAPRRPSTFDAVVFNEGLESRFNYTQQVDFVVAPRASLATTQPDIKLPQRRKRQGVAPNIGITENIAGSKDESESEEDSFESDTTMSDVDYAPKLPWNTKKRKKHSEEEVVFPKPYDALWLKADDDGQLAEHALNNPSESLADTLLDFAEGGDTGDVVRHRPHTLGFNNNLFLRLMENNSTLEIPVNLGKPDMVYVAQLISEQALGCLSALSQALTIPDGSDGPAFQAELVALQARTQEVVSQYFPMIENCELAGLALAKDRTTLMSQPRPGQPRPPQRADTMASGPDVFAFPAPYVRIRRGQETYEMLPPALDFWEPLNLGPPNGHKNVQAFGVLPANTGLRHRLRDFIDDLGSAYESCKLGSHQRGSFAGDDGASPKIEDNLALIEISDDHSIDAMLQAYRSTCVTLGSLLSKVGLSEVGPTIVIYMVDPFSDTAASQALCACFWLLYKVYCAHVHKAGRGQPCCDIVLQMLPIALVARSNELTILSRADMTMLAKEVYDRCPPSSNEQKHWRAPARRTLCAPFVELAQVLPRKIQFQLTSDPPSDLLHEGSILHLAYAMSEDRQWMTVHWINGTGSYQRSAAFPLRGRTLAELIEEVWDHTREAMLVRAVMWRVFILSSVPDQDNSSQQCWRKVVAEQPRKQVLSVTFIVSQTELPICLTPPDVLDESSNMLSAGFPTPATTPSGTALTASPDTNPHANAPPTPAPSESVIPAETDPDAQLIDVSDETWGMLFAPPYNSPPSLASGALFKRGQNSGQAGTPLPSFGASVLWTIHVRPTGQVDEGSAKHAELTLKDVLRMYRALTVLTKAKGLIMQDNDAATPVHLIAAVRAAKALNGLVS